MTTDKVIAYKGFDKDLSCRGFKFEVGKSYVHNGDIKVCESGFHACENPLDVLLYYGLGSGNRFAVVELSGEAKKEDEKTCASNITIKAELDLKNFIKAAIDFISSDKMKEQASGDGSKLVASGYESRLASSGNQANLAASGDRSYLAASGYNPHLVASGRESYLAASGYRSHLVASGEWSQLVSSGYISQLAASGNWSGLASSGHRARIASSGYGSRLAASGDWSDLASSGGKSKIVAAGYGSNLDQTDNIGILCAIGDKSKVKGTLGSLICLVSYNEYGEAVGFVTGKIGEKGLKPGVWYEVKRGKFSEVSR